MRRQLFLIVCAAIGCGVTTGNAQEDPHKPISIVDDWSTRKVVFSEDVPRQLWEKVLAEPRFWQQYYRRHSHRMMPSVPNVDEDTDEREPERRWDPREGRRHRSVERDWSVSLGTGNGGAISAPAKYVFDVTAPVTSASCTADFVVTGISAAGSTTQANIIGLNNLYVNTAGTGLCSGTAPKVIFAYNVGTGVVQSASALSLDGTKVAFVENISTTSSRFHVLTFKTGAGNGTSATAPAVPGTGNTASEKLVTFAAGSTAAPFIDYANDVAYITTDSPTASVVHKITGVFLGTPTEVTTGGWPATIPGDPGVSTPVFDGVSKHVFFTDGTGFLDYIDDSVSPAVVHSGSSTNGGWAFASNGIGATPGTVDSTRGLVYATAGNPNGANAVVAQADINLSTASRVTVNVGSASGNNVRAGDFNNAYYSGGASTASFLYVVGNDRSVAQGPALYNIGFNSSFKLNTTTANGPLALSNGLATGVQASPVTEFFNQPTSTDFIFVGVTNACQTLGITGGCIRSLNITSAFPTAANNVILAATGGTGIITVDNYSSSAGASSVYYTTLGGNSIVKATQAGLQ